MERIAEERKDDVGFINLAVDSKPVKASL